MSETTTSTATKSRAVATGRLWWAGALAALLASVVNLVIYFAFPAIFNFTLAIPLSSSQPEQLPFIVVIVVTVLASLVATGLMALLKLTTNRPVTIFRVVAAVILLASLGGPFSLPVALSIQLTLSVMHILTAAIIIYFLTVRGES